MAIVLSTLTSAQDYTFYRQGGEDGVNVPTKVIHLNGGSNVADKHFVTAHGVITELSDADLEQLRTHPIFQLPVNNGFVTILKSDKEEEKAKQNMTAEDASAPLTPQKYEKRGKRAPKSKE